MPEGNLPLRDALQQPIKLKLPCWKEVKTHTQIHKQWCEDWVTDFWGSANTAEYLALKLNRQISWELVKSDGFSCNGQCTCANILAQSNSILNDFWPWPWADKNNSKTPRLFRNYSEWPPTHILPSWPWFCTDWTTHCRASFVDFHRFGVGSLTVFSLFQDAFFAESTLASIEFTKCLLDTQRRWKSIARAIARDAISTSKLQTFCWVSLHSSFYCHASQVS